MWIYRLAVTALCSVSFVAHADEPVATYIEHEGKTIELASDVVSSLDEGTGEIVYIAFEADDLVTPANVETVGKTLRVIGWRRAGDRIVIYRTHRLAYWKRALVGWARRAATTHSQRLGKERGGLLRESPLVIC